MQRGDENVFPEPTAATVVGPQFEQAVQAMVSGNPTWKGVVGTVPDVLAFSIFSANKSYCFNST